MVVVKLKYYVNVVLDLFFKSFYLFMEIVLLLKVCTFVIIDVIFDIDDGKKFILS